MISLSNYDKMLQVQQENIQLGKESVLLAVKDLFYSGKKISVLAVAEKSGMSASFIYAHPELLDDINYYKKINQEHITHEQIKLLIEENSNLVRRIEQYSQIMESMLNKN